MATGGARGVTAILLDAILRDYQCTVIALGRSSLEAGPKNRDDADVERDFYDRFVREHPGASAHEMKKTFETTRAHWEAHRNVERLSSLGVASSTSSPTLRTKTRSRRQYKRLPRDMAELIS